MKNIKFLFVHHNNYRLLEQLITSIENMNLLDNYEIHIADSGSNFDELEKVKKINKKFHLYEFDNLGYFNCINLVLFQLKKNDCYILVGNEDLVFAPNFYTNFIKNIHLYETFEVVCPSLITNDGVSQNPHVLQSISKFRKFIYNIYYSNYLLSKIILFVSNSSKIFKRNDSLQNNNSKVIFMCHGSCFILTPQFFKYFNFILSPDFLCQEEAFLRKQLNLIDGKIIFDPELLVYHKDSVSVKKIPKYEFWKISSMSYQKIKDIL